MRSELEILEQIDQYLGGKMTADQSAAFSDQMNADPGLKSMVQNQELLIQTVNRQAMMAELNSIAGAAGAVGGAAGWGITQWLITTISIVGVSVAGYFVYDSFQEEELTQNTIEATESNEIQDEGIVSDTGNFISFELAEATDEYEDELRVYSESNREGLNNSKDNFKPYDESKPTNDGLMVAIDDGTKPIGNKVKPDNSEKTFTNNTTSTKNRKASFPGGKIAMKKFIKKNLMYPRTPKDKGLQGTVKVNFLVSEDGEITHLESDCFIMKDKHGKPLSTSKMFSNKKSQKYFEENAERIFRISSPWTTATNSDGNPILSSQTWYVNFDINGESSAYQLDEEISAESSCGISSEEDWEKVEVRVMNVKRTPKNFNLIGESMLNVNREIKDVEDLSSGQYQEICKLAAKSKACVVYIDVNEFWGAQDGNLYYYFGSFR